jgi:hypothetical protein
VEAGEDLTGWSSAAHCPSLLTISPSGEWEIMMFLPKQSEQWKRKAWMSERWGRRVVLVDAEAGTFGLFRKNSRHTASRRSRHPGLI